MSSLVPGQRLPVDETASFRVQFAGEDANRLAVAGITPDGRTIAFDELGDGCWQISSFSLIGAKADIVAYITDDTCGGFVTGAYPLSATIGSTHFDFPKPDEQLAAVILGEVYERDGTRRLKISNEGYTFGIDAYVRARDLRSIDIPHRRRSAPHDERLPSHGPSGGPAPRGVLGSGSGVIIAPDLIVTNAHVIEDGETFRIGRSKECSQVLAVDPMHDLALLQARTAGEPMPLRIGSPIWLGEAVMASGYPLMDVLGADLKVTTGNVSGLTGSGGDISRFQFTAPIGSGSSGGAIIDEAGNVVGITSASLAHESFRERGSLSENVNFAVRAAFVFELAAAAGVALPSTTVLTSTDRRQVVNRLRGAVVSILVLA